MPAKTVKKSFEKKVLEALKKRNKKATMKDAKKRLDRLISSIEDPKSTFN
jgi:hypothetical protein